jgi:hypothetical protein
MFHYLWSSLLYVIAQKCSLHCCYYCLSDVLIRGYWEDPCPPVTIYKNKPAYLAYVKLVLGFLIPLFSYVGSTFLRILNILSSWIVTSYELYLCYLAYGDMAEKTHFDVLACKLSFTHPLLLLCFIPFIDGGIAVWHHMRICCMLLRTLLSVSYPVPTINLYLRSTN